MPRTRKFKKLPTDQKQISGSAKDGTLVDAVKTIFGGINERRIKILAELERQYDKTENPLFVWYAWQFSREIGFSIPEWVLEYFDTSARVLLTYPNTADDISKLLGFAAIKAPFKVFHDYFIRYEAVNTVIREFEENPNSQTAYRVAADKISEKFGRDVAERTIKNWYYEFD